MLGNARYSPQSLKPLLDCEQFEDVDLNNIGEHDEVFYEEPDLSGGVEGVDYFIRYGAADGGESE